MQQIGAAGASGLGVGEGAGANTSSSTGLMANGAADLLQASRDEHVRKGSTEPRPCQCARSVLDLFFGTTSCADHVLCAA